ncbi:MAG: 4a-hydroxytetrahydrobiopterin dehydratase [Marmoricola sp.]|nr:4a-hydroxytetrahydrobiopterin dehydratase [Marmoricola sp.]
MALLSTDEVASELATLPGWDRAGATIVRSVQADSFLAGLDLVLAVGRAAEEVDHHPDIDIRWRTITFTLSTHSDGGLTAKDFDLARTIEGLVG